LLILGSLAALGTLGILIYGASRLESGIEWSASVFAGALRPLLGSYVKEDLLPMMDEYVEVSLIPGMREKMFGWAFAQMAPSGSPEEVASDEHRQSRARRRACPSRNAALCSAASAACRDLVTCRAQRAEGICTQFSMEVNDVCVHNNCDEYTDRSICGRVTHLCRGRIRCFFNVTACADLETELLQLCGYLS
jgi:hypothetical protein